MEAKLRDPWKHRSSEMICRVCMWYVRKEKADKAEPIVPWLGRCRKHAPTMSGFPVVFEVDWCGDHKLNENAQ